MALTEKEIETLYDKVRPRSLLAGAIAKLYLASPDPAKRYYSEEGSFLRIFPEMSSKQWTESGIQGGLVLALDNQRGALSFEIWNIKTFRCAFAYEVYFDMVYDKLTDSFHCFEVDDCVMGFAFSNQQAASIFFNKVETVLAVTESRSTTPYLRPNYKGVLAKSPSASSSANALEDKGPLLGMSPKIVTPKSPKSKSKSKSKSKNMARSPPIKKPKPREKRTVKMTKMSQITSENGKNGSFVGRKGSGNGNGSFIGSEIRSFVESVEGENNISKVGSKGAAAVENITRKVSNLGSALGSFVESTTEKVAKAGAKVRQNSRNRGFNLPFWKRKDITDMEFSMPFHVEKKIDIALNPDGTFDLHNIPKHWKKTFKDAGITKRDLKNPAIANTIFETLQTQEMLLTYKEQPEYANVADEELEEMIAAQQKSEYDEYLRQYEQYDHEQKAIDKYNREAESLMKWEQEIGSKLVKKQREQNDSIEDMPPPIPDRDTIPADTKAKHAGKKEKRSKKKPDTDSIRLPPAPDLPDFMKPSSKAKRKGKPKLPALPPIAKKNSHGRKNSDNKRQHGAKDNKRPRRSPNRGDKPGTGSDNKPRRSPNRGGNKPRKNDDKPDFLGKLNNGRISLQHLSAKATLKRLNHKLNTSGAHKTTLVSKLRTAMEERRKVINNESVRFKDTPDFESEDEESDWSIDD